MRERSIQLSFDVEDWFQSPDLQHEIPRCRWTSTELRVGRNTEWILKTLDKAGAKATFFVLGWVAERLPDLVAQIGNAGHEIASHGYGHQPVHELSAAQFRNDIRTSKSVLEDLSGRSVVGYRAPRFSITAQAVDILAEEGFLYDSSHFPTRLRRVYGDIGGLCEADRISRLTSGLVEVPIATLPILSMRFPWGGAGYFRLCPYSVFRRGIDSILSRTGLFVFYFHPWEIDTGQPRARNVGLEFRLRHYLGLRKASAKLTELIRHYPTTTIRSRLVQDGWLEGKRRAQRGSRLHQYR